MKTTQTLPGLPVPKFFDPKNAAKWAYRPDLSTVFSDASEWRRKMNVKPAANDGKKVFLMGIDIQKDFCFPEGTLYVAGQSGTGAVDDSARIADFIYRNLSYITKIIPTLDTHLAYQIFFAPFWMKADGSPVSPNTPITVADIDLGKYQVSQLAAAALDLDYVWLMQYARHYCAELEKTDKQALFIWPFHCMLGTPGHSLVGVVEEAAMFHAFARGASLIPEIKGGNPLTENYSPLRPEVLVAHDGKVIAQKSAKLIKAVHESDRIIVLGQAKSHCVAEFIKDTLVELKAKDPALAKKVYIVEDGMSSVVIPGVVDFTQQGDDAVKKFMAADMHVVKSTDPIDSWPDF